jgi:hypothetical protein
VPNTAIAVDLHKPLDILADLPAQLTLDYEVAVDLLTDAGYLFVGQFADLGLRRNGRMITYPAGYARAYSENVAQRHGHAFIAGYVHSCYASH